MIRLIGVVLGLLLLVGTSSAIKSTPVKLFNQLLKGYDMRSAPSEVSGKPVEVQISFYVSNTKVDTEKKEMVLDTYFRQTWVDERLRFPADEELEEMSFGDGPDDQIWTPDTFFRNAISVDWVTSDNVLVRIYKTGKVWLAQKVILTIRCPMHFQKYPFDTQECSIRVESFRHTSDSLQLKFLDKGFNFDEPSEIDGFSLENHKLLDCAMNYTSGIYPCLAVKLILKRDHGAFSKHRFFPSALVLFFIYTSTWMGSQILLPRALVLIAGILLLGANMITSSIVLPHPVVGYMTAGDIWYPVIIILVMLAIIEFCVVAILCNRTDGVSENSKHTSIGNVLEWIFRIGFLVTIIVFLVVYFALYSIG
ncbi:glycine receptor subunit alpha-2-like [Lineus longissimus]|uniref:glycine receptor subunit alpha-2-like n=1 Tax=Lineus longissimus TaxID=88925 RepID=UPI002B4D3794